MIALHVDSEEGDCNELQRNWSTLVKMPAERAGLAAPPLVLLKSPYRFVLGPILDYVLDLERENPDRQIAVLIPELVERRWLHYLLHNQRTQWLKALLLVKGNQRIV